MRAKKQKEKSKKISPINNVEEKFISPKTKTPSFNLSYSSVKKLSPNTSSFQTADRTVVLKVKRNRKVDMSKEGHEISRNLFQQHQWEKEKV